MSSKATLLAPATRRYVTVETPIGPFTLRSLTERERTDFELFMEEAAKNKTKRRLVKAKMIVLTLVDDDSKNPMLTDSDMNSLLEQDAAVTSALFDGALTHAGFSEEDRASIEKKSEPTGDALSKPE